MHAGRQLYNVGKRNSVLHTVDVHISRVSVERGSSRDNIYILSLVLVYIYIMHVAQ